MHLFLRSDLLKAGVGVPCPHGGGVECLMHGGTGQASHTPRTAAHDDPFGGHRALVSHDIAVEPYNKDHYHPDSKPLKKPLSATRSLGLAKRVLETSHKYNERPEEFDALPEHHQRAVTDGLHAAHEVLRRHNHNNRNNNRRSPNTYRDIESKSWEARDLSSDLKARRGLKDLAEGRKKFKTPKGHLKDGTSKKQVALTTEVQGNRVPRSMDEAHEAVFHYIFGDHPYEALHGAYSLDHPKYTSDINELHMEHSGDRAEASIRGAVHPKGSRHEAGTFSRAFTRKRDGKLHVYHGTFFINGPHQNHGIVGKVFRNSFGFYQKAGVHHVEVQPVEVGKYTWPRMGFHWGHDGNEAARRELPQYMRDHFGMGREERHKLTGEVAHKPWEVAKLEMPLPEKTGPNQHGNFKYVGKEQHPRKPGEVKYKYYNTDLESMDNDGNPLTIEGTNAPEYHPDHDPSKGAPRINAGQDFLLSKHGARVWGAAHHGHILMDPKDPGYQNLCEYLKLKPEDATAAPQELADYHTSRPHRMPEREADEGYGSSRPRTSSSRSGTCSNCGEETESRYDSYCPSCQKDKEKHEALMEQKREEKREKKAKLERKENKRQLAERDTLNPGDEVQPHHVIDALPDYRGMSEYTTPSRRVGAVPAWERRSERGYGSDRGQQVAGPLSEPGVKIKIRHDPRYKGTWVLGKDRHWRPIRVGSDQPHLPWSVLHSLAQSGHVHRHDDRGSYTPDYRQTHLHDKISREIERRHPRKPSGLMSPQARKWGKYQDAAWEIRRRGGR
jgi:hypothetical protein